MLQVVMVTDIQTQFDFRRLSRKSLDLGFVDVDVEVGKMAENVFEDADAINHLDADLDRIGGGASGIWT